MMFSQNYILHNMTPLNSNQSETQSPERDFVGGVIGDERMV